MRPWNLATMLEYPDIVSLLEEAGVTPTPVSRRPSVYILKYCIFDAR